MPDWPKPFPYKRILAYSIPLIALLGALLHFYYRQIGLAYENTLRAVQTTTVEVLKTDIEDRLKGAFSDTLFLTRSANIRNFAATRSSLSHSLAVEDLTAFMRTKKFYHRLRFIDLAEREAINIETKNGQPWEVMGASPPDRSTRFYFRKTLELPDGHVFLSPMNLVEEDGKLETPLHPTLRFSAPVFEKSGRLLGVLMLNFCARNLLNEIEEASGTGPQRLLLANGQGYWLKGLSPDDEWGFQLAGREDKTFAERFPQAWAAIRTSDRASVLTPGGLFHCATIYPEGLDTNSGHTTHYENSQDTPVWKLVSLIPRATLTAGLASQKMRYIGLFASGSTVVLLFSALLAISTEHRKRTQQTLAENAALLTKTNRALQMEIGERKHTEASLRESEARFRGILDAAVDGIITVDRDGIIESANPAAAWLFGYAQHTLPGTGLMRLFPPEHHEGYAELLRKQHSTSEVKGVRSDGTPLDLELSSSLVDLGDRPLYALIVRDISERKAMERMKNEFIATINHELRTPITAINGAVGLIRGGAAGEIPAPMQPLLDVAHSSGERLLRLINDILTIDRIESGRLDLNRTPLELMPVIENAVAESQLFCQKRGIRFVITESVQNARVMADEDRLGQVLGNLLSNAAKFSSDNSPVRVSVTRNGGMLRISVADKGTCVPEHFRKHIFKKFAQADSSDTRSKEGTGLGLAISKAIVEMHGGQIDYENHKDGCTFFFDIPEYK